MRALVLTLVTILLAISALGQMAAGEYHLKAAFLHTFAKFVEWPDDQLAPSAPIVIGLVGDDPFGRAIDEVVFGRSANGRAVRIQRLRWNDSFQGCHILFISSSELPHLRQILESLQGSSILTVGDMDRFAARGGMIELRMAGSRVRFEVNLMPASQARLKISSKLLQVAQTVYSASNGAR